MHILRAGLMIRVPAYVRTDCPRKSPPSSICVMRVFSGERSRPRSRRNCATRGLTSWAKRSYELPVMMQSSASFPTCTLACWARRVCGGKMPSGALQAPQVPEERSRGSTYPSCGTPAAVGESTGLSMNPAFSHVWSMAVSIGRWAKSHSWRFSETGPPCSPRSLRRAASGQGIDALLHGLRRGALGAEPLRVRIAQCLCEGIQREQVEGLHRPVVPRRHRQGAAACGPSFLECRCLQWARASLAAASPRWRMLSSPGCPR